MQNFGYSYDIFANLVARKDNKRNLEETFTYDHLNRLTDIWLNDVHTGHMAYDALGRMTGKMVDGQQVFGNAQYGYTGPDGQLRPHAVSNAQVLGNPFPTEQLDIDYTMFDKVRFINANTGKTLGYAYGYNHQRTMLCETVLSVTRMKHYVGNCEFVMRIGSQQELTYLSGPMGVFAVVEKENGAENIHYIYKDHLGSWTTITDANGTVEREQSFDAWGNMRDPDTWTGTVTQQPMFDRGFTGHEHLNSFGLINMNGRMYDPVMSSFLSVDNYVQAPDFSQSFNRYAYCLNNPLRYTDPSGEIAVIDDILIAAAIGAAISVTMNGISNSMNNVGFFQGAGKAAIVGCLAGATGAGVAALGAGAGVVGMAAGAVSGGTSAAFNKTSVLLGVFYGGVSGWIGGGVSQYIGGGWGALAGGAVSNAVAQVPGLLRGEKFDYKQMLISSGLSWGMYMGSSYFNWQCRGGKKMGDLDVSFKQYCKMQTLFQRSRACGIEMGGYLMDDGSFRKLPNGTSSQITFEGTPPEGAIAEFHTHWDKPGAVRLLNERGSDYIDFNNYEDGTTLNHVAAAKVSRYHGITDFTEGIQSIVINRYDGSYFSGEYMIQNLPGDFIGPPNWVPTPYQVINPPVLRYNYGFLFSIRY